MPHDMSATAKPHHEEEETGPKEKVEYRFHCMLRAQTELRIRRFGYVRTGPEPTKVTGRWWRCAGGRFNSTLNIKHRSDRRHARVEKLNRQ